MKFLILIIFCHLTIPIDVAYGVPEDELEKRQAEIAEFVNENLVHSTFRGSGDKQLAWAHLPGDKNLPPIVISEGLGESIPYYSEFFYDLVHQLENKQSVYIFDLRGQGLSEHLSDHPGVIHVDHFENYVSDLEKFVEKIVQPNHELPARILAHSTGALVALKLLSRRPELAEKILFVTPLFGIDYGSMPSWTMNWLAVILDSIGFRKRFIPFRQNKVFPSFSGNRLTTSEARYVHIQRTLEGQARPASVGPSVGFVRQVQIALNDIDALTSKFSVPAMVLTADEDAFVSTAHAQHSCKSMKTCTSYAFSKSKHVVLHERDEIREKVLSLIRDFLL